MIDNGMQYLSIKHMPFGRVTQDIERKIRYMRLGIVGSGMIVQEILPMLCQMEIDEIYLLVRPESEEKGIRLCQEYGLAGYYTDYTKMLEENIDTIYIALPNHLHYAYAKQAFEADKHVVVEKPMVPTVKEFDTLCALAKEHNRLLIEAINIPYLPAYQFLKEHVNELGAIRIVNFNFSQYSSRYDAFKEGKVAPVFDVNKAGGALMDINVYNLHAIVGLFGRPERVVYHANIERGIDTSGILTLDYGKFQVVAIGAKDCSAPTVSTIQGDAGYVRIDGPTNQFHTYVLAKNKQEEIVHSYNIGEHRLSYEWKKFIQMINDKDIKTAENILLNCRIVCEIMERARHGQGIYFPGETVE